MRSKGFGIRLYTLLALWPLVSAAQDKEPLWEIGLGVAGLSMPDYRGSDERSGYLLPFPYVVYNGEHFQVNREGIRGDLFESKRIEFDFSAAGSTPAKTRSAARHDMPDLNPAFELGPAIRVNLNDDPDRSGGWSLVLPVRAVVATDFRKTQSLGWVASPYIEYDQPRFYGRLELALSFGPMYAGERYHDYYYEVSPDFATAERPAYDAKGGYSGSRLTATLTRRYKDYWWGAFLRYDDLSGAKLTDSPLVRKNSAFMAGFGIAWVLARARQPAAE
jgi:MipA family protein